MDDLTRYRAEIDEIDAQMILLFERRMDIVRQVALYKDVYKRQGDGCAEPLLHAADRAAMHGNDLPANR